MTPYHVNVNGTHALFVRLIFVAAIDNENFQIYGTSFWIGTPDKALGWFSLGFVEDKLFEF